MALLFTRIFITGAPLLKLPTVKPPNVDTSTFRPNPRRLMTSIPTLHAFYDYFLALPAADINTFSGFDWGGLILTVVLGYRMSFPLHNCPEWDDREARRHVRFGEYVDRLCRMGDAAEDGEDIHARLTPATSGQKTMDVLSASKVVLAVVRKKFQRRVNKLEQAAKQQQQQSGSILQAMWAAATGIAGGAHQPGMDMPWQGAQQADAAASGPGCPMLDGSLEPFYPYWDETFAASHLGVPGGVGIGAASVPEQQQSTAAAYDNDVWGTIMMGWAQDNITFEGM